MYKIPLSEILVENSSYTNRSVLKSRLFKEGLLRNECYTCGLTDSWNGLPITLQLEHINGVSNDNRLENLSILCPNCHSQTETFAGRNSRIIRPCPVCSLPLKDGRAKFHRQCWTPSQKARPNPDSRKIDWPELETLKAMIKDSNYVQVAKELGVSDNAVRKHIIREEQYLNP